MALTGWSNSNYLRRLSQVYDTLPFAVFYWGNSPSFAAVQCAILISPNNANDNNAARLYVTTGAVPAALASQVGSSGSCNSTGTATTNTWFHHGAELISTTSRAVLRDGANKGTNATSITAAASTNIYIGNRLAATDPWSSTGGIAEISIWGGSMTGANMDSLSAKLFNGGAAGAGGNPLNITAESSQPWSGQLKAYWPLTSTSDLTDASGNGHTLSMVGTLTNFAGHPTIEAVGGVNTDRTPGTMIRGT